MATIWQFQKLSALTSKVRYSREMNRQQLLASS
ncbi:hypothetical protein CPS_3983 [Colwellia psychrerythraea 34H]|uniref:Uncharacterized protein n=1 Tax=Colwellia psychrerythraea (strain 34H / ATCC BAA-681) TaxID=167879 RepID=Q47X29_COLP3|nr:hypothetical protein CPS_3983 [Colwellia psychrerythraea 34H]